MNSKLVRKLKSLGLNPEDEQRFMRELDVSKSHKITSPFKNKKTVFKSFYEWNDFETLLSFKNFDKPATASLESLEDLLERDNKREEDGFPRRIRIGKFIKPGKDKKEKIVIVPTTTEPKFYHDSSITDEEQTGGSGEGEEGEVIGQSQAEPEEGEGEGSGAGQGDSSSHDMENNAFDLGKVLTEKFQLPNIKTKGTKRSFSKFQYDLTDKNRGFGQLLDKKSTLKKIIETNILLGNITEEQDFDPENLIINPQDEIFRILSREKEFEAQAVVFFIRDYSGSMQGKPTESVVTQHLLIYSWLMYQYQKNVQVRFILHDTDAKEVPDFYTYYKSAVAGGTNIYPAYDLVNKIVFEEQLVRDNNIYVFQGTDGDDWESNGEKAIESLNVMLAYANRVGITIAKNSWSGFNNETVVEKYIESSGLLKNKHDLFRMDSFMAEEATETRLIEGIKKIIS